ncbi:unnamed protein product [Symbiodinium natans]|uniref:Tetratricopeptide repeat protein 39B n=1 Tax=Symbiodinium natans TaxID=878477 RepID=A0A812I2R1_9DINO|nr:unnamed protein product [Symbiodinium natans]
MGDEATQGSFAFKQRRLLTKRGCWLGRTVTRWCQVERDELVYYASKEATVPRGRVALTECALGREHDQLEPWPKAQVAPSKVSISKTLQLVRPGKSPILINGTSEEMASFVAFILSRKKKPIAETLPDLPASPTMPEIPPIGPQFMPYSKSREPETTLARIASRTSEWSAPVPEELTESTDISPGSSSSTSKARQSQASVFHEVVHGLGPKLAYRKAMELMWNYDLQAARVLLDPWRATVLWHAAAYAECSLLRTILTGRKSDALATLEMIKVAETLRENSSTSLAHELLAAEILLMRSLLQVMLGQRLRALYNLRQSWYAYFRLEQSLESESALQSCALDVECVLTYEDLRGRILFGLGFFYMATSLIPSSLVPLIRLAGFCMHRERGKTYLFECVERALGARATPAAILLAMYHLDLEPDMKHAGNILIASLGRQPENALLHWAGSLLAWRNTFMAQAVSITSKALWCCGEELGEKAVYLRYELGMFHFIAMEWPKAHEHLSCVYNSVNSDKVFFPYRSLVTTQLAAVAFSMGQDEQGESLCKECAAMQDWSTLLKIESDFARILQIFLRRRRRQRQLLAFEVMYFLRQFPKVPAHMLLALKESVRKTTKPFDEDTEWQNESAGTDESSMVEMVSALTLQVVICFYLGDAEAAMVFIPDLSQLCPRLPAWAMYLSAHGLYWCGRILALTGRDTDARTCFQQAKMYKKYPFNISVKISKVLAEHEEQMAQQEELTSSAC